MDFLQIEDEQYRSSAEKILAERGWSGLAIGKVITVHRDSYLVRDAEAEYRCQLLGHLQYEAEIDREKIPVVGDWVLFQVFDDQGIIHGLLPRKSVLARERGNAKQLITSNVDGGLIIMGADRDFNLNRAERYISLCHAGGVTPMVVVTKIDNLTPAQYDDLLQASRERFTDTHFFWVDSVTGRGLTGLSEALETDRTYALMGSSGAGKSTLMNALLHDEKMKTGTISASVNKGKHTTTHRELVALPNGAFLIDNPGLRAVGVGTAGEGLGATFVSIEALVAECRFADCTHTNEPGCRVLEALEAGEVSEDTYLNFLRLARETEHYESTEHERRKKGKSLAALVKKHKKEHKR